MIHRQIKNAKFIFDIMVPLTLIAFYLGSLTVNQNLFFLSSMKSFDLFDGLGGVLATICVFAYNYMDEKPQKTSIENL